MREVLGIFFRAEGTRPIPVLLCLVLAGLASGIGLASLLPLMAVAIEGTLPADSLITRFIVGLLGDLGLEPVFETLLMLLIVTVLFKAALTVIAKNYVGKALAEVAAGMRARLIRSLMDVRWAFFATQPVGRIANAISVEATNSGKAYDMASSFFAFAIQAVVSITVALLISWKLALSALVMGLAIVAALHTLVKISRRAGYIQNERTRELVIYLSDALNNIKGLKAMAKQEGFARLFERKIESLRRALRRQVLSLEARRALEDVLITLCLAAAFYLAVAVWAFPISEVLVMAVVMQQTMRHIGKLQELYQKAVFLESPFRSVTTLIAEVRDAQEAEHGGMPPSLNKICRLDDVSFSFSGKKVLDQVCLDIPARQITVLTGPSGGGKTTISDLILGLQTPDAGHIFIDDTDLRAIDLAAWRRMVGYVPQELTLFHDTVFANIALGDPQFGEKEVRQALEMAGAWDFVAELPDGMMSTAGERGLKFSGGQRQRIALARALIASPALLVLDEATSALDPETEIDLCQRMRNLSVSITILAITHRPAFLDIADLVYRVEDGKALPMVNDPPALANHNSA